MLVITQTEIVGGEYAVCEGDALGRVVATFPRTPEGLKAADAMIAPKAVTRVPAHALQPGDLVGSGETVARHPSAGVRTPRGKVEVVLVRERDGALVHRVALWGRHTLIGVYRDTVKA